MAPQHANQHGMHLRQNAIPGPACGPPPQGRAAGLNRCRGQAAPEHPFTQEPPQRRQHPDRFGGRVAASAGAAYIGLIGDCTLISLRRTRPGVWLMHHNFWWRHDTKTHHWRSITLKASAPRMKTDQIRGPASLA